jgi:nicotinamide-nucleotide amidase
MFDATLLEAGRRLIADFAESGLRIATAESCTGGLIAALLTEVPGSSRVFERGFVTYTIEAKSEMIGVDPSLIARVGAVSPEVANAMAEGALRNSRADVAVAVTGIAGPEGGTPEKPVGLVHIAAVRRDQPTHHTLHRFGPIGREAIRLAAVAEALTLLRAAARLGAA